MRRILAGLACVGLIASAQAQFAFTGAMLMPNPLGIIISLGQWIIWEGEKTYYIEVAGEGATLEESRLNGFRIAVEQAVGSVIASETEVNNSHLTRDEIISYASGYVTRYEIVNQEPSNNGYQTKMKVWIKKSAIANRLLNESKVSGDLEGAKAAAQLSTLQYERSQGDRLVGIVLNDFYRRGMNIELQPAQLKFDNNRNGTLVIPFKLSWNRDYLNSLWEALKATAQDPRAGSCWGNCNQNAAVIAIATGGFMGGNGGKLGFSDVARANALINTMILSNPAIELTVLTNQNQVMHRECFYWPVLDHQENGWTDGKYFVNIRNYGSPDININGNFSRELAIQLRTTPEQMNLASQTQLKLVPKSQCSN